MPQNMQGLLGFDIGAMPPQGGAPDMFAGGGGFMGLNQGGGVLDGQGNPVQSGPQGMVDFNAMARQLAGPMPELPQMPGLIPINGMQGGGGFGGEVWPNQPGAPVPGGPLAPPESNIPGIGSGQLGNWMNPAIPGGLPGSPLNLGDNQFPNPGGAFQLPPWMEGPEDFFGSMGGY